MTPKPTFLIIDDDEDTLFLRRHVLRKAFPESVLHSARTVEEALASSVGTVDAIIADHFIREPRAQATLQALVERSPNCHVVVVTNSDDPALRRKALSAGANVVFNGGADFCGWLRERL